MYPAMLRQEYYRLMELGKMTKSKSNYNQLCANTAALGTVLVAWGKWIFNSKSKTSTYHANAEALAVDKYVMTTITNVIKGVDRLGASGGHFIIT